MNKVLTYKTAGGIVIDSEGQLLTLSRTVYRNGHPMNELRLPKGHIDPGETDQDAALREVGEESGYWDVEIIGDLGEGHSSFYLDGVRYERDEHYFLMRLKDRACNAPQPMSAEEALFEPFWAPPGQAADLLTYPTEKEFAARAADFIARNS